MDYSKKVNLMEAYLEPPDYDPPKDIKDLEQTTQYPNMNSVEYRLKASSYQTGTAMQPFLEVIEQNHAGNIVIAGNNYTSRKFCGSFFGWDSAKDGMSSDCKKICFKMQCDYFVRVIKFVNSTLFVLGNSRGSLELFSSKSDDKADKYCLFTLAVENSHIGPVSVLDVFQNDRTKCISGSKDGFLKVWDIGDRDLHVASTISYAHCDEITGLSTSKTNTSLFVTCSRDKAAFTWDLRGNKPATALYDEHKFAFTDLYWTTDTPNDSLVWLADETGALHQVDTRKPNEFIKSVDVFDEAIHRLRYSKEKLAVIGDNQTVKVFNTKFDLLYENSDASDYLRDVLWSNSATNEFYTIGWDSHFKKHTFPDK